MPWSGSSEILSISDNSPFLLSDSFGKGDLFLFSIGLSSRWSEFSTSLVFLPLVRGIVEYSVRDDGGGIVKLVQGENNLDALATAGFEEVPELGDEPGVIVLQNKPVELNYTRAESDFSAGEGYQIERHLTGGKAVTGAEKKMVASVTHSDARLLKVPLAWFLVGMMFLELILANWRSSKSGRNSPGKAQLEN